MSLAPGKTIGVYQVVALIGAGGMGEVYKASDTRLHRDVALKVLPDFFAGDAHRLARLQREAEVLASLNQPNIATIHGLEEADGVRALVLELVEGPTLAGRIAQGPIALDEVLPIARQVAEALEAAHERNIVHRDLKPSNIKVRPDGLVKVLDFGLAKAVHGDPTGYPSTSPTLTAPTLTGVTVGTAAYMSPEQARGKPVDKRTDIWAFGCVLFEMLVGRPVFEGETVAEVLAGVLTAEPDWARLPGETPPEIRRLLRRCLQRDRGRRLHDMADARIQIEEAQAEPRTGGEATRPARRPRERLARSAAALLAMGSVAAGAVAVTLFGWSSFTTQPSEQALQRTSILLPDSFRFDSTPASRLALSPDGLRLAFAGSGSDGVSRIWIRALDSLEADPLSGTDGASYPFWSPDSRSVAFVARRSVGAGEGSLKRIDAAGGPVATLSNEAMASTGFWNQNNVILFTPTIGSPIHKISVSGGAATPVTRLDAEADARHENPFVLPDGRHFLYVAIGKGGLYLRGIYVASLDSGEVGKLLIEGGSNAQYADGHVLFLRDAVLMAQPFDPAALQLRGEALAIAAPVAVGGNTGRAGAFSVSTTGTLAYHTGSDGVRSQLTWCDRTGKEIATLGEPGDYNSPELSPDGHRLVVSVLDPSGRDRNLWIYDVTSGRPTRFTFDRADEFQSTWSPAGDRIVFSSRRLGRLNLYYKNSSGAGGEQVLLEDAVSKAPFSHSPDGQFLSYNTTRQTPRTGADLLLLPLTGERKPRSLLATPFEEGRGRISPDGRWIAYSSNEGGSAGVEVYVAPFPSMAGKWQISRGGGDWPRWRRDGKEIYFMAADGLAAVELGYQGETLIPGSVRPLFQTRARVTAAAGVGGYPYDVSADGQRFLVNRLIDDLTAVPVTLVSNWTKALKK